MIYKRGFFKTVIKRFKIVKKLNGFELSDIKLAWRTFLPIKNRHYKITWTADLQNHQNMYFGDYPKTKCDRAKWSKFSFLASKTTLDRLYSYKPAQKKRF